MVEITVGICEAFKEIGIDISEADLRKFEKALYERGLNVAPPCRMEAAMDVLDKLRDLHKQATTERSHYYVAATCLETIHEIERLRLVMAEAMDPMLDKHDIRATIAGGLGWSGPVIVNR